MDKMDNFLPTCSEQVGCSSNWRDWCTLFNTIAACLRFSLLQKSILLIFFIYNVNVRPVNLVRRYLESLLFLLLVTLFWTCVDYQPLVFSQKVTCGHLNNHYGHCLFGAQQEQINRTIVLYLSAEYRTIIALFGCELYNKETEHSWPKGATSIQRPESVCNSDPDPHLQVTLNSSLCCSLWPPPQALLTDYS